MGKKNRKSSKPSTSSSAAVETPLVVETDPLIAQKIYDFLSRLPPCFRFAPTDDQLIIDYLRPKIANRQIPLCLIHPVNLYLFHPRTLEETHLKHPEGDEMYYFTPRDRKYKNGTRPTRGVEGIGFWKATGADVKIKLGDEIIGYSKTLVFYEGLPKTGKKTNWIMNEYRTCESRKRTSNEDMKLDDWVICKIHEKQVRVAKMEKKEEGDVNTNEGDTNTENALKDANVIEDITGEEGNRVNDFTQSHQGTGLPQNSLPFNNEEITYEEDTRVYENCCRTFCQNDFTQAHQDMGWSHNSPLFNTYREDITMSNDDPGTSYSNMIDVPGTSYSNTFVDQFNDSYSNTFVDKFNDDPEFNHQFLDQWEKDLIYNKENLDWSLAWDNSCNFQNSSNGLNVNYPETFQDSSGLNDKGFINYQDSSSGFNIMDSNQDDLDDGKQTQWLDQ